MKPTHDPVLFEPSHTRPLQRLPCVAPTHAALVPCGFPEIGEQLPVAVARSHASHCPEHALLQQTPSTQKPLAHESFEVQAVPAGLACLHLRFCKSQNEFGEQSAFEAQVMPHVADAPVQR